MSENEEITLQTERLILRQFREDDWQAVHEYGSDPEAVTYMPFGPNSEQDTKDFIKRELAHQKAQPRLVFNFALIDRKENRLIGAYAVSNRSEVIPERNIESSEGEIGYILNRRYWNRGYMTEATRRVMDFGFEELGFHRIFATCHPANTGSYRVMEKIGMQREGYLRDYRFMKGHWRDFLMYSILEKEWTSHKANSSSKYYPSQITEIISSADIQASVEVIRTSFATVAMEFGLTKQNCPAHTSNVTYEQLMEIKKKGLKFFGLFLNEKMIGFVAVENSGAGLFHFEKLAIRPEYRHRGYGTQLVKHALDYARDHNGQKLTIGIIDEHTVLKKWYNGQGFKLTGTQKFLQLPFTVGFMEKDLTLRIRPYTQAEESEVIHLWHRCDLVKPWNNPELDIARKMKINPELFLVGIMDKKVIATAMGGYEGHRGWVNYLAVDPAYQRHGFGRQIMETIEKQLVGMGCPKINLQVRNGNEQALKFYSKIGYKDDNVISLGKRLIKDAPV